jgi:hypothetical protein
MLRLTEPRKSFGPVLGAIIVAVIFQLSTPDTEFDRLITVVLQAWVVVLALRAAGAKARVRNIGTGTAVALVAFAVVSELIGNTGPAVARSISLALILVTPLAVVGGVVRELDEDRRVTVQTVLCGLCLYLLLGMAFSLLFAAIEDVGGVAFFASVPPGGVVQPTGSPNDFLYYSLATLTTTGYGDFTAATELGRAMSVVEALIGQMYLVTVLAVIVSNVRRRRPLDGT